VLLRALGGVRLVEDDPGQPRVRLQDADQQPSSFQPIFAAVDALDLELLTRLDAILLPDFRGENDLVMGIEGKTRGRFARTLTNRTTSERIGSSPKGSRDAMLIMA
jgi:hypothetical protein